MREIFKENFEIGGSIPPLKGDQLIIITHNSPLEGGRGVFLRGPADVIE